MGRHFWVSFRELTCIYMKLNNASYIITRPLVMIDVGPLANPHLCVFTERGAVQFKWQVLFKTLASGSQCYNYRAILGAAEASFRFQGLPRH